MKFLSTKSSYICHSKQTPENIFKNKRRDEILQASFFHFENKHSSPGQAPKQVGLHNFHTC